MNQKRFLEEKAGDETVIFDSVNEQYHSLSEESMFVLSQLRDGRSQDETADALAAKFPASAPHAAEIVGELKAEFEARGLTGGAETFRLDQKMARRSVLKVAGLTLLATVAASAPAAASSGSIRVTQAFFGHINNFTNTLAAPCNGSPNLATNIQDVTSIAQSYGTTDTSTQSTYFIPGARNTRTAFPAGWGFDGTGGAPGGQNSVNIQGTCGGTNFSVHVCETLDVTITCP